MNTFTKRRNILSFLAVGTLVFAVISCEKAMPSPYSNPPVGVSSTYTTTTTPPDTTPSFLASVNNSSILTFTPSKSTSGSNTTLKGVDAYYTITLTFPSTTGPGHYTIGTSFYPDFTALLVNGSSTYVVNSRWGLGNLTIDSISTHGKYYGTFSFDASDTVTNTDITVNQGSFYHL